MMSESPESIDEPVEPPTAEQMDLASEPLSLPAPEASANPELATLPSAAAVAEDVPPEPESSPSPAVPEELLAAKWYTTGFLVVVSLLSVVSLIGLIVLTVKLFGVVMD